MKHIKDILKQRALAQGKETERGELLRYFCAELNVSRVQDGLPKITIARMGYMLQGIPTKDLYYLQSVCKDAKNFSKKFWWEVKGKLKNGRGDR